MKVPALTDIKQLLTVWARFALQYEKDTKALTPAVGQVTLITSSATTTLSNAAITPVKKVILVPTTAHAAAELATLYLSTPTQGQVVINHANNSQADRTFNYIIAGL